MMRITIQNSTMTTTRTPRRAIFFNITFLVVSLFATPWSYSADTCLRVLQMKSMDTPEGDAGEIRYTSLTRPPMKNFRNFRIDGIELVPSLSIEIQSRHDASVFNSDGPIKFHHPLPGTKTPIELRRVTDDDWTLSSSFFYGASQKIRFKKNKNRLVLKKNQVSAWTDLNAAIELAEAVTTEYSLFGKYHIDIPIPNRSIEKLEQMVEIANQALLPMLMVPMPSSYLNSIDQLARTVDAKFSFKQPQAGLPVLSLSGNLANGRRQLLIMQLLLSALELSRDDLILEGWPEAQKAISAQKQQASIRTKLLDLVISPESIPVPPLPELSLEQMLDLKGPLIYPEIVEQNLQLYLGRHWRLLVQKSAAEKRTLFKNKRDSFDTLFEFIHTHLIKPVFEELPDRPSFTTLFDMEESPKIIELLDQSPEQIFDHYKKNGLFIGVSTYSRMKHADLTFSLENPPQYSIAHGTFALIELSKEEYREAKNKLDVLHRYRIDYDFPLFSYQGDDPLYLNKIDANGTFQIDPDSPAYGNQNQFQRSSIQTQFHIIDENGVPFLEANKHPFFKIPLIKRNDKYILSSMSCAQWTYFAAKTLFPDLRFPSFSSPDELISTLKRGDFPRIQYMGSW